MKRKLNWREQLKEKKGRNRSKRDYGRGDRFQLK